jgi:hypothetical protein
LRQMEKLVLMRTGKSSMCQHDVDEDARQSGQPEFSR